MKVLVTGGRRYNGVQIVWNFLDRLHAERGIHLLIQGGATGADAHAKRWAERRGILPATYSVTQAEWARFGKAAGPMRNQRMLDETEPDVVVAFPGNTGTADMVARARAAGFRTMKIEYAPAGVEVLFAT